MFSPTTQQLRQSISEMENNRIIRNSVINNLEQINTLVIETNNLMNQFEFDSSLNTLININNNVNIQTSRISASQSSSSTRQSQQPNSTSEQSLPILTSTQLRMIEDMCQGNYVRSKDFTYDNINALASFKNMNNNNFKIYFVRITQNICENDKKNLRNRINRRCNHEKTKEYARNYYRLKISR